MTAVPADWHPASYALDGPDPEAGEDYVCGPQILAENPQRWQYLFNRALPVRAPTPEEAALIEQHRAERDRDLLEPPPPPRPAPPHVDLTEPEPAAPPAEADDAPLLDDHAEDALRRFNEAHAEFADDADHTLTPDDATSVIDTADHE